MDRLRQRLELQQQGLRDWQSRQEERIQRQAEREAEREAERAEEQAQRSEELLEGLERKIEQIWMGGVRADPDEQRQKLVRSVEPVYPDVAKRAGIEGTVLLKVVIARDGIVKAVKVVSGEPVLADAAKDAVKKWRYQPTILDGKPVNVVTTVTVEFRLR
jgi:TonB family protein